MEHKLILVKNFLPKEEYQNIYDIVTSIDFNWNIEDYNNPKIKLNPNSKQGEYHFVHMIINHELKDKSEKGLYILNTLANNIVKYFKKPINVARARVNLFTNQHKQMPLSYHKDISDKGWWTMLYYLENSNGYTQFHKTEEKVKSVANSALFFRADIKHRTLLHTDVPLRRNININFEMEEK
tara:strand:- start:132 stop:677 length:546 start_codon:yes stop_codon:yes gene_type:complete